MMPTSTARVHVLFTLETFFFQGCLVIKKALAETLHMGTHGKDFFIIKKKDQKCNRQLFLRDTKLKAPITEKDTCQARSPKCTFVYFKIHFKKMEDG